MRKKPTDFLTISERLSYLAETCPQNIAYYFTNSANEEITLTYGELDHEAKLIASQLQASGVKKGDRIILFYQPGFPFIKALFGCFYAGAIGVPLCLPLNAQHQEKFYLVLKNCTAKLILSDTASFKSVKIALDSLQKPPKYLLTDQLENSIVIPNKIWLSQPHELAILQYTSGSTGNPKGVMVSHENIMLNEQLITKRFSLNVRNTCITANWLPHYHDMGLIAGILMPLYLGRPMVLMSPLSFLGNPISWLKTIMHYRASVSGGPNFAYALCVKKITEEQCNGLDLSSWSIAFNGAEPLSPYVLKSFSEKFAPYGFKPNAFFPCYGLAEATLIVSIAQSDKEPKTITIEKKSLQRGICVLKNKKNSSKQVLKEIVSCGKPLQAIKIVNPTTRKECKELEVGEIWVNDPSMAKGYWKQKKETKETFHAVLRNQKHPLYLRTGDLGFLYKGELYVTGRIKEIIILAGKNHYPSDIEMTLTTEYPDITTGYMSAFSVTENDEEQLIILIGKAKSFNPVDFNVFCQNMASTLFQHHHITPQKILLVKPSDILKTSSGKIRHLACKAAFLNRKLQVLSAWTTDITNNHQHQHCDDQSILSQLKKMVADHLKIDAENLDVNLPLATYGIDSIAAIQLSAIASELLQREISPLLIYEYPTLNALASYLSTGNKSTNETNDLPFFEPIAIIGMACKFPGKTDTPEDLWKLLAEGKNPITEIPTSRKKKIDWGEHIPEHLKKEAIFKGGYLNDIDKFDAAFFNIPPQEAAVMDPQQRLLLETSWQALENAGIAPKALYGSQTGVYVGISQNDYAYQIRRANNIDYLNPYCLTGNILATSSGRISYALGLQGPSLSMDTACSSSLVAVNVACNHLQQKQCELAVVGGVNIILNPETSIMLSQAQALSPDGKCKVFDIHANGYVRSEGCGVVILKTLSSALKDNNNILAIIRSSVINQDGHTQGLTAPNKQAQVKLMKESLARAHLSPDEIDYIEAHGTGTKLGDPIEISAITEVFNNKKREHPLIVGSVKSNIGHLESAAGMASLIKVILSLQQKQIPANMHFKQCNPLIDLSAIPAIIPTKVIPWEQGKIARRATINSFGFSGTNANLIVEESNTQTNIKMLTRQKFNKQSHWVNNKNRDILDEILKNPMKKQLEVLVKENQLDAYNPDLLESYCLMLISTVIEKIKKESLPITEKHKKLSTHFLRLTKKVFTHVEAEQIIKEFPQFQLEVQLAKKCGDQLADILQGKINPLSLLFANDSSPSASRLYRDSVYAKTTNKLIQTALNKLEQTYFNNKNVNILEIGGGTGGVTHHILPILSKINHYVFTDLSTFFLNTAAKNFTQYQFMRYGLLDIEQPPATQGYTQSFDVIIGANVLHATKSIETSLFHIKSLLSPGGILILLESTAPSAWLDITFGLLEDWWRFSDFTLRPDYPLLSVKKWKTVLKKMQFPDVFSVTCPGNTQQTVIIARNDETRNALMPTENCITSYANQNTISSDKRDKLLKQIINVSDDKKALHIEEFIKEYIANMLNLPTKNIPNDINIRLLGIDSLMTMALINELQVIVGENAMLTTTALLEKNTVSQLAEYIIELISPSQVIMPPVSEAKNQSAIQIPDFTSD